MRPFLKGNKATVSIYLLLFSSALYAQSLQRVRSIINGDKVEIRYDLLEAPSPEATYEVLVYSNINQFTTPMEKVTGDVGKDVTPGVDKLIIWDPKAELARFIGEIYFEVRVNIVLPYVSFSNPVEGSAMKRGTTTTIRWSGGSPNEKLQVELYRNDARIRTLQSVDNTGELNWAVPVDLKPGKSYQLKVTSLNNADNFSFTKGFVIKRKIPMVLKFLPVILGAGAAVLLGGGGGGAQPIPDPPNLN